MTQQSPDEVRLGVEGVVGIGPDGALASFAPGRAEVSGTVEDTRCDFFRTSVAIDIAGNWSASCANGDTGSVSFASYPRTVVSAHISETGLSAPTQYVARVRARGTTCFANADDAFSCSQPGEIIASVSGSSDNQLCSVGSPCPWITIDECAAARHDGASHITGAVSFEANGCAYTRGDPVPGSGCQPTCEAPAEYAQCSATEFEYACDQAAPVGQVCIDAIPCICEGLSDYLDCGVEHSGRVVDECSPLEMTAEEARACRCAIGVDYVECVGRARPGCDDMTACARAKWMRDNTCTFP